MAVTPLDTQIVGDLAHEHGTFTVTATPKAGGDATTDNGKYLIVLRRGADGVWKIHHDADNSDSPPPGSSAPAN